MSKFDWYEESIKEERQKAERQKAERKSLTIENLARTIHDQLSRCDIPKERIHTYAIKDSIISFVILPGQLLISVTKSDSSDSSDSSDECNESQHSSSTASTALSESSTSSNSTAQTNAIKDQTTQNKQVSSVKSQEWIEVRKAGKVQKDVGKKGPNKGVKHYELFRDPANVDFMDYDHTTTQFSELKEFVDTHPGCHAYCPEKNIVFDFSDEKNPCRYRIFTPNQQYQMKYEQYWNTEWTTEHIYTLFRDHFNYNTITGKNEPPEEIAQKLTLTEVRATIKRLCLDYAHAIRADQKEIINFTRHGFKLMQRVVVS